MAPWTRWQGPTLRDRIFFLLVVAILFGSATSLVSVWSLGRATRAGQEAVRSELAASQALGAVSADRLEQSRAFERALRVAGEGALPVEGSPYELAKARFEGHTRAVWSGFQAVAVALDPETVARVDHAHNEYAAAARKVFAAADAGDLAEARRLAKALEPAERHYARALADTLEHASLGSEATLARLDDERRTAILWVSALTAIALLGGFAVTGRTVHLVSKLHSLEGLLPICSQCKAIRDDQGYWNQLESYVEANSEARFTHGLCEGCVTDLKARIEESRSTDAEQPSVA